MHFYRKLTAHRRRLRPKSFETLEARQLLSAQPWAIDQSVHGLATQTIDPLWFTSDRQAILRSPASLPTDTRADEMGPKNYRPIDWVVQLAPGVLNQVGTLTSVDLLLSQGAVEFQTLRGLGTQGLVHVRSTTASAAQVEAALAANDAVSAFSPNLAIGATVLPDDSDFGNQFALHNLGQFGWTIDADIDAPEAWGQTTGSWQTVVGVIDSGIDVTHPDLYLNIWINQGEIRSELRQQLVDVDDDGLISFFDLNAIENTAWVRDFNGNRYIDAQDLLADPHWSDGVDTDLNGFIDDLFGWNFRNDSSESLAPNNPLDRLGHGTHVAGIIGASGNNGRGVTGINWRTSLMSLKFLDENNQGDIASAIAAIHYATMMRSTYETNVRVLNASWGQAGSAVAELEQAIATAAAADILFVAAAGNGNVLGVGVDNDRTAFFPASFTTNNIISVAASDGHDQLASFSNYGSLSVDLAAPGVGIRSTLPGGLYGEANGTSMATPLVTGTAALLWSILPQATMAEVRQAILDTADQRNELARTSTTGGRLNAANALRAGTFAPTVTLLQTEAVTTAGATQHEIVVRYWDRNGIALTTIDDHDLHVTHQWGSPRSYALQLKPDSLVANDDRTEVIATYIMTPPGGAWDVMDFGDYTIHSIAGSVSSATGPLSVRSSRIGNFRVQIEAVNVLYVDTYDDPVGPESTVRSLRRALELVNSSPDQHFTILLDAGVYQLEQPIQMDPDFTFGIAPHNSTQVSCGVLPLNSGWSNATTGDLDVIGQVTIIGSQAATSVIDAQLLDRAFKVHDTGRLSLQRLTITGGLAPAGQGGGGILNVGTLALDEVIVRDNSAADSSDVPGRGGGIASWGGALHVAQSHLTENTAQVGGALFSCGPTMTTIIASTLDNNRGGGFVSYAMYDSHIDSTTIANNFGGAVVSRAGDLPGTSGISFGPTISRDGQRVAFLSSSSDLALQDTNAVVDAFVYEVAKHQITRASLSSSGQEANAGSQLLALSDDGQHLVFASLANNLVSGDGLSSPDTFVRTLDAQSTRLVSTTGSTLRAVRGQAAISGDGRWIAYQQAVADDPMNNWAVYISDQLTGMVQRLDLALAEGVGVANMAALDQLRMSADGQTILIGASRSGTADGNLHPLYIYDRPTNQLQELPVRPLGGQVNGSLYQASINDDGRYVAFVSDDSQLVDNDTNAQPDIFVFDRHLGVTQRINLNAQAGQADQASSAPSISGDGRWIAFSSQATNLVVGDDNGLSDVFVVDRALGTIQLISRSVSGGFSNGSSQTPVISGDGHWIAFTSAANDLVDSHARHRPMVTEGNTQVYLAQRATGEITAVSSFGLPSSVAVTNSTLVFNTGQATLAGNVTSRNSLMAGNLTALDFGGRTASDGHNIYASSAADALLTVEDVRNSTTALRLSELTTLAGRPPGFQLLEGNPAIDAGSPQAVDTLDQWQRPRLQPDIGAIETISGSLSGRVFLDLNRNGLQESNEPGLAGQRVYLDLNNDGIEQSDEPTTLTSDPTGSGYYRFDHLVPGSHTVRVALPLHWSVVAPATVRVGPGNIQGNGPSTSPIFGSSGKHVAFVSTASNFVSGDTLAANIFIYELDTGHIEKVPIEGANLRLLGLMGPDDQWVLLRTDTGVFLYDRRLQNVEAVSRSNTGQLANAHSDWAAASQDGRWIAYSSFANNLVSGDVDNFADIFLWDRAEQKVLSLTVQATGQQGNNDSEWPVISDDGAVIAFVSDAANLVADDTNGLSDIFVYRRTDASLQRITLGPGNVQSNGFSYAPQLSGNGRYVVFQSFANNLVPGDVNNASDLFVYDLQTSTMERLEIPFVASSIVLNYQPSISMDGQYVTFEATRAQLNWPGATSVRNVFVYDRFWSPAANQPRLQLVSQSATNDIPSQSGNELSSLARFSRDGRQVIFQSQASNLTSGDTNGLSDIFVSANPFERSSRTSTVQIGQQLSIMSFALAPDPGTISGVLFHDLSQDRVFDEGDPALSAWTVYIDSNLNGRRDVGEPTAISDQAGTYHLTNVPTQRDIALAVEVPVGWEQVAPSNRPSMVFLPAGSQSLQRDFAFQPKGTIGQSQNARIEGRVFNDLNRDGLQQSGEAGVAGVEVYLDLNHNARRDFDEPRGLTDAQGNYSFSQLGARDYVVRTVLGEGTSLTSPVGNQFSETISTLSSSSIALSRPQTVLLADLDGILGPDAVVALYSGNSVVVQLNDGLGRFGTNSIHIALPVGSSGPIAMASGQLNGRDGLDVIVANSLSSTLSILLDFNGNEFRQKTTLAVGAMPMDVALADLDGDGDLDVLVATQTTGLAGQLRTFLNNGQGQFIAGSVTSTAGMRPVSLATGDFNDDGRMDVVIANQGDFGRNGDSGSVAVLTGRHGGFNNATTYIVGSTPVNVAVGDLNGDGRLDIAAANFAVNTATILRGEANAIFTPLTQQISVGQGPVQVELIDIDSDGDRDVIISNLKSQSISIIRNRASRMLSNDFSFEPAESFAVAQLAVGPRLGFAAADVDSNGALDLAVVNSESNSLRLLSNRLIAGANRVQLSGTGTVTAQDFGVRSEVLLPKIGALSGPTSVLEDAGAISLQLNGVVRGRTSGPPLRLTATTSDVNLLATPVAVIDEAMGTGRIDLATLAQANGSVLITVELRDAGADQAFDTMDDGVITRTHTLTITPVNDAPWINVGGNQVVTIGSPMRFVTGFASGFHPGGGSDESSQSIAEFIVANDRTDLFLVQPAIDNSGTLRFQPRLTPGVANLQVRVRDTGGTESGGVDRSAWQTFQIAVIDLADGDIDFGDAPAVYPVLISQDGARHRISGLYLGTAIDAESNGQPTVDAAGDDANFDDEDGLVFVLPPIVSESQPTLASVSAFVSSSAGTAARLDAWIDFNQDGDWNDSGEQILTSAIVQPGRNLLSYTVPAGARAGVSFARFRLSSLGGLSPTGLAEEGEVEDYAVSLLSSSDVHAVAFQTELVGDHIWLIRDGQLQLQVGEATHSNSSTLFSVPASRLSEVRGQLPEGQSLYVLRDPMRNLWGSLQAQVETSTVSWLLDAPAIDLAILSEGAFDGIDRVVLTNSAAQTLRLHPNHLSSLGRSPDLQFVLGMGDTLLSSAAWQLSDRQLRSGELVHAFRSGVSQLWVQSVITWMNPWMATDTNGDGVTTPLDALLIINVLNSRASGNGLPVFDPIQPLDVYFVDVNGDQNVTPLDALLVINVLNSRA